MPIGLMSIKLNKTEIKSLIDKALYEDLGKNQLDATTNAVIDNSIEISAHIRTRQDCRIAGIQIVEQVFKRIDTDIKIDCYFKDGNDVKAGVSILKIFGSASSVLIGERTALNIFQRMCGIATLTSKFKKAANRSDLLILDTRKTTPGLRIIEKAAVEIGGGVNHRMGLYDSILIKDNHLSICHKYNGSDIKDVITLAKSKFPNLKLQVEVDTIEQLKSVVITNPDWVLLDNMCIEDLSKSVEICKGICKTEASGNINLNSIERVAATGVDAVSIGFLTHSVPSIDIGLDIIE